MNPADASFIARLVELFETHGGAVPGRELTAEDFDIQKLERDGFIFRTGSHLDGGRYLIGAKLERAVARGSMCVPDLEVQTVLGRQP